jgi:hypothetical protein
MNSNDSNLFKQMGLSKNVINLLGGNLNIGQNTIKNMIGGNMKKICIFLMYKGATVQSDKFVGLYCSEFNIGTLEDINLDTFNTKFSKLLNDHKKVDETLVVTSVIYDESMEGKYQSMNLLIDDYIKEESKELFMDTYKNVLVSSDEELSLSGGNCGCGSQSRSMQMNGGKYDHKVRKYLHKIKNYLHDMEKQGKTIPEEYKKYLN